MTCLLYSIAMLQQDKCKYSVFCWDTRRVIVILFSGNLAIANSISAWKRVFIQLLWYIFRCVLLTLWQKLHTVSRQTLTSEGMRRSILNLVEWWTTRKTEAGPRGILIRLPFLWFYIYVCTVILLISLKGPGNANYQIS